MAKMPKSSFELAMERLRAADPAGAREKPLSSKQREEIAEARRVATAPLAETEILFKDAMKQAHDPAEREKAEREDKIDRQPTNEDRDPATDAIRRAGA